MFFHFTCATQKKSRSYGTDVQLIYSDFTTLISFGSVFPPKALALHCGRASNFVYQKLLWLCLSQTYFQLNGSLIIMLVHLQISAFST